MIPLIFTLNLLAQCLEIKYLLLHATAIVARITIGQERKREGSSILEAEGKKKVDINYYIRGASFKTCFKIAEIKRIRVYARERE